MRSKKFKNPYVFVLTLGFVFCLSYPIGSSVAGSYGGVIVRYTERGNVPVTAYEELSIYRRLDDDSLDPLDSLDESEDKDKDEYEYGSAVSTEEFYAGRSSTSSTTLIATTTTNNNNFANANIATNNIANAAYAYFMPNVYPKIDSKNKYFGSE
ncbi:hypothetical protein FACS1894152_4030 [Bacilli bacterium]|nr:hypothetical protein FACS1894152_4030 [Bacilli bacterium]